MKLAWGRQSIHGLPVAAQVASSLQSVLHNHAGQEAWKTQLGTSYAKMGKIIEDTGIYIWGMGRLRSFTGMDWNGFASVRVQMEGSKSIAYLKSMQPWIS